MANCSPACRIRGACSARTVRGKPLRNHPALPSVTAGSRASSDYRDARLPQFSASPRSATAEALSTPTCLSSPAPCALRRPRHRALQPGGHAASSERCTALLKQAPVAMPEPEPDSENSPNESLASIDAGVAVDEPELTAGSPASSDAPKGPESEEEQSTDSTAVSIFPNDTDPIWSWRRKMVAKMLTFIGPAMFIPLADPLMSVVDTVTVGQFASTMELAGLGPVTLIFTFVNYIWNSQGIATTTLVADALNRPSPDSKHPPHVEAGRVLASSLLMAAVMGAAACTCLQLFGPRLLQLTGAAPELIDPALSYLRIRALATPASYGIVVSQAALLAQRKSLLPCLVIAASAATNFVLDVFLIVNCGMGVAGAAWATLASQYLAMGLMLVMLHSKQSQVNPEWHVPTVADLKKFASSTGPLAFIYICKNLCNVSLQRAAAVLPVLQLAAHQPTFMLWNLCTFGITPVEQAALAFIPAARTARQKAEMPKMIMASGLAFAAVAGIVSLAVPWMIPGFFSPDQRLYPFMRQIAPLAFVSAIVYGLDVAATSILMSKKMYTAVSATMTRTVMLMGCYAVFLTQADLGLYGVWFGLIVFYGSRMIQNIPCMLDAVRGDSPVFSFSMSKSGRGPGSQGNQELSPQT